MKWQITGADRATGADVVRSVLANTMAEAQEMANRQGVLVCSIEPEPLPVSRPLTPPVPSTDEAPTLKSSSTLRHPGLILAAAGALQGILLLAAIVSDHSLTLTQSLRLTIAVLAIAAGLRIHIRLTGRPLTTGLALYIPHRARRQTLPQPQPKIIPDLDQDALLLAYLNESRIVRTTFFQPTA